MAGRILPFDWNDIPVLVALAHSGSMRTTARRLGVDTSTISRRVAAAEKALKTRLFVRGPDGYKPTDAGRAFLSGAEGIEGSIHALLSDTSRDAEAVTGAVRLTSVDVVLYEWLIPRLSELRRLHPELELRAIADNHVLSFTRGEADLAIRVARPREDAAIVMRRISAIGMAVYGNAQYGRTGRSRWSNTPWIAFDEDLADSAESKWLTKNVPGYRPSFRCSSMSGVIRACEAGLGLALLPCFAAARSDSLVRLSAAPEFQRDLYLLSHRQTGKIRRFKVVVDWIAALAQRDAAILLEGGR
jgi:DNA-binding transcriptional LysR family regulator